MADGDTSVGVTKSTLERMNDVKPFQSMSHDDLINDALDHYEAVKSVYDSASELALADGGPDGAD